MNLGHDQEVVRYIIDMCIDEDVIQYYTNLHDHHQKDELLKILESKIYNINFKRKNDSIL